MNFLIVGMGGSGTQFLANVMNRSKQWTVEHEGIHKGNKYNHENIQAEFDRRKKYGTVNGFLRFTIEKFNLNKAIIVRRPKDIYLGWYSHFQGKVQSHWYIDVYNTLRILDRAMDNGVNMIRFEKMTTDKHYLGMVLNDFGINDVDLSQIDLTKKVNSHYKGGVYEDIPEFERNMFEHLTNWFDEKYYHSRSR